MKTLELIGELTCRVPVGEERSGKQCKRCHIQNREFEFYYPPRKGLEESSARVWESLMHLATQCYNQDAQPGWLETGLKQLEVASKVFMARWDAVSEEHGVDMLNMSGEQLKKAGCTSIKEYPASYEPETPTPVPVSLDGIMEEVKRTGLYVKRLVLEVRENAENTKTEMDEIHETMRFLEEEMANLRIQHDEAISESDVEPVKVMKEIKELAEAAKTHGKTLSAVKTQVDRVAIRLSKVFSAYNIPDGMSKGGEEGK